MKTIRSIFWAGIVVMLGIAPLAVSAAGGPKTQFTFSNPIKYDSIEALLQGILKIVIQLGTIVAILMFIYAGFLYVTAQGDESRVKEAHQTFLNTAIGTAILLGATAIALLIKTTIGNVSSSSGLFN